MEIKDFQNKCSDIVKKLDEKYKIDRDPQLAFSQFMEEVGELIKEVDKPRLRNKEMDSENLRGEFADVFMQLFALASMFDVDVEKAMEEKIKVLKERGYLE